MLISNGFWLMGGCRDSGAAGDREFAATEGEEAAQDFRKMG